MAVDDHPCVSWMLEHLFSGSLVNLAGTRQHLGARHRSLAQELQELGEFAHSCVFFGWNAIICIQPVECIACINCHPPAKSAWNQSSQTWSWGTCQPEKKGFTFTVSQIKHIKVSSLTCPVFAAKYPVSHFTLNLTTILSIFPAKIHGFSRGFLPSFPSHLAHPRRCTATPEARPRRPRPRVPWPSSRRAASWRPRRMSHWWFFLGNIWNKDGTMIGENNLYGVVLYTIVHFFFNKTSVDLHDSARLVFTAVEWKKHLLIVLFGFWNVEWHISMFSMVWKHPRFGSAGWSWWLFILFWVSKVWKVTLFVWGMCLGWSGVYPNSIWAHKGAKCANDWGGRNQFNSDLVKTPTWSSTNLEKGKHNSHMILLHCSASTGHGTIGHDLQERPVLASGTRNT